MIIYIDADRIFSNAIDSCKCPGLSHNGKLKDNWKLQKMENLWFTVDYLTEHESVYLHGSLNQKNVYV